MPYSAGPSWPVWRRAGRPRLYQFGYPVHDQGRYAVRLHHGLATDPLRGHQESRHKLPAIGRPPGCRRLAPRLRRQDRLDAGRTRPEREAARSATQRKRRNPENQRRPLNTSLLKDKFAFKVVA